MATNKPKWVAPASIKREEDMTGIWPAYGEPSIFPWSEVDGNLLRAALHVLTVRGYSVMFGTAMGGRGAVVTLYGVSKTNPKRFALGAEEMHALLWGIVQQWGSPAEDLGQVFGYDINGARAAD
jgi:hypothetical protein